MALGLWQAGAGATWGADYDESDSIRAIHAAADVGINLLDTAPAYNRGSSEELVGRAIADRRDRYVLATKLSTNQITRQQVRTAVEASLRRLAVETIDLLQIHWPNSQGEPFAETLGAMQELQQEGKLRALGVSNFSAAQLAECLATTRIDSLQPPYNLLWRHVETATLPFCGQHELGVICYSPLAQGLLSGKYDQTNRPHDGTRPRNLLWHGRCFEVALQVVDALRRIAAAHNSTCAQVALAWLLHQPGVTSVIAGAKRPDQVADNARGADLRLSAAELTALAAASDPLLTLTADEPKMWFTGQAGEYDVR
ncbi:MAG: aldo/keto reductase [Fimbriimonadaceae bacterium]|nr:aldo/keto reductase [Fimbriimonadaceae bacterium]